MIYTYDIKKNNTKKNPSNNNAHKATDAIILSNLKKTIPYLFGNNKKKTITIDLTENEPKRTYPITIDITKKSNRSNKPTFSEFINAFNYLIYGNKDTYDYLLSDGTPIKIFDDEIQIGLDLYDKNDAPKILFSTLSEENKKNIIDIYINIKK